MALFIITSRQYSSLFFLVLPPLLLNIIMVFLPQITNELMQDISGLAFVAQQRSAQDVTDHRRNLLNQMNGDLFYPLSEWPMMYRVNFFRKPIDDTLTFQLLLFLIGNGCAVLPSCDWIFSSLHFSNDPLVFNKRCLQLCTILKDIHRRRYDWFYYDIFHRDPFDSNQRRK